MSTLEPNAVSSAAASMDEYPIIVFLMDDQPMIGEAIRRMLADETDIRFHYCGNPLDALSQAVAIEPSVILQDLVMPGIDGMTLVREYRSNERTRDIPIIVLSSKEEATVKSEAFAGGANDYLVKLPDKIELIARVRHHSKAHINRLQRDVAYKALSESQQQLVLRNAQLESLNRKLESAQSQLLQSEKMASVGQLAAGIAHEINNPMAFVISNLVVLQRYLDTFISLLGDYQRLKPALGADHPDVRRVEAFEERENVAFLREDVASLMLETLDGVNRVQKIVKDLRNFSPIDETEWQKVDIRETIESALNVLLHKVREKAEVVLECAELPAVECLAFQIRQVFLNIVVNASQAMDGGGRITIRTGLDGKQIWVSVSDTGSGIPPENLNRVFEPFFTTRPIGKGTGLGLSVAYSIVNAHGGSIEVLSPPGEGATFTVRLPINPEREREEEVPKSDQPV